ncbi:hypothetical protein BV20DRAFT_45622 [Pilatotrama ljubarskyi]|nr:hypothetical protein BV20DRAFT_45622 [Pilatotrama ljubarskyi]
MSAMRAIPQSLISGRSLCSPTFLSLQQNIVPQGASAPLDPATRISRGFWHTAQLSSQILRERYASKKPRRCDPGPSSTARRDLTPARGDRARPARSPARRQSDPWDFSFAPMAGRCHCDANTTPQRRGSHQQQITLLRDQKSARTAKLLRRRCAHGIYEATVGPGGVCAIYDRF